MKEDTIMSLTGKEIAQMHKDYVMQSWSKSGVDALRWKEQREFIFTIMTGKNMLIWHRFWYVQIWDMNFRRL